jgi:hypothetical protein
LSGVLSRSLAFALVACSICVACPARADGGASRVVDVVLVGALAHDDALGRRITSWFDPEAFQVSIERAGEVDANRVLSPERRDVFYAWLTLENGRLARLYFVTVGREGPVYLLRDLVLENGADELGAERIAQVVYSSIQALTASRGQTRREDIEQSLSTKRPPPAPRRPEPLPIEVGRGPSGPKWGIGYGASYRGVEGLWHGPRASASVDLFGRFGMRAAAAGVFPTKHDFGEATVGFYGVSFYLAPYYRHAVTGSSELEWSAGPGLDVVHFAPSSGEANVIVGSGGTDARPSIAGEARLLVARGHAALILRCALDLSRTHYDVVRDGQLQIVGRPWPVAPGLGLEFLP